MNDFHKLMKEICMEKNITFSVLSKDWIVMLEKDNKTRFISGYKFDLNNHGFGNVMDDKYATYEVLAKKGIPIIEHKILFNKNNKNEYANKSNNYELVEYYFKKHNQSIVLKANNSTCGNEVYYLNDFKEIPIYLDKLFAKNFSISICPFYKIKTEYRLIVLNNECVLMYGKKRPIVVGDGVKTIRQLLREFNTYYFENKLMEEEYARVLEKNEIYEYGWQFNLSKGSIPIKVEDKKLEKKLLEFIKKITNKIYLGFCSVDIIETMNNELFIMELNSGVMMKNFMQIVPDGYAIAKDVYKKAIEEMFKN